MGKEAFYVSFIIIKSGKIDNIFILLLPDLFLLLLRVREAEEKSQKREREEERNKTKEVK